MKYRLRLAVILTVAVAIAVVLGGLVATGTLRLFNGTSSHAPANRGPGSPLDYAVTFSESGVPTGTMWSVTLGTSTESAQVPTISFQETNGTYDFTVAPEPGFRSLPATGSVTVDGAGVGQSVTFAPVAPEEYAVTFNETGLPAATSWNVTFNGTEQASTSSSIVFEATNGSWPYTVAPVAGFESATVSGTAVVDGAAVEVPIAFSLQPPTTYTITFEESGLLPSTLWNITFNGTSRASTGTSIAFPSPNGTWPYSVGAVPAFVATSPSGTVNVDGAPVSVPIGFSVAPGEFPVWFNETGLPATTEWKVTYNGSARGASSDSIEFESVNGSWPFEVGNVHGFDRSPSAGTVNVTGAAANISVDFYLPPPEQFDVTFNESGLAGGTTWNVTLAGSEENSTGSMIGFSIANGTWPFTVASVGSYEPDPASGSVVVQGRNVLENVTFEVAAQQTLVLGGSVSAYPFDDFAVTQFEQNNSDVEISNDQGGDGAGMIAVCGGQIDIGVTDIPENLTMLEKYGCSPNAVITPFAYDAVGVIVPAGDPHGLESVSWDTLTAIYDHASSTTPTLIAPSIDGVSTSAAPLDELPAGDLEWEQIPACVAGASPCGTVEGSSLPEAPVGELGPGTSCEGDSELVCASGSPLASPCGFTICAGGATPTARIVTTGISSDEDSNQAFAARLLGAVNATSFATTTAGLGFTGCGVYFELSECGLSTNVSVDGDAGAVSAVSGSTNSIGYASLYVEQENSTEVSIVPFLGVGQSAGNSSAAWSNGGIVPTLGTDGTIAAGIGLSSSTAPPYVGWLEYEYVTAAAPAGLEQSFITFVLDPANNNNLAAEADDISFYAV